MSLRMIYGTTFGFCFLSALIELYLIENLIVYNQQRSNQHDKQPASSNQHDQQPASSNQHDQQPASSNQHPTTSMTSNQHPVTSIQQPASSNHQPV
jgi:hypothetical protein